MAEMPMFRQDTEFKFQRLPSAAELNTLTPTSYSNVYSSTYDGSPSSPSSPANIANTPEFHYDPVRAPIVDDQYISPVYRIISLITHFVLTLAPIIFLMLAFAALSVDGQPLSDKGRTVLEAAKVGPSLFPIVFAAVVGRLMRTFALWKAERGSSIGLLEQLNGSQNFLAALERAFYLHGLGGWSIIIITLWALSPLGGQSSLRVLSVTESSTALQNPLSYFNTHNYSSSAFMGASALNWERPTVSAIYQACLLAPDKVTSSSTDLWGNVKIPLMQALPSYSGLPNQDWLSVPASDTIYSSLSGVMISGLKVNATANFTIESTYFNLTCGQPKFIPFPVNVSTAEALYRPLREWTGPLTYHHNVSALFFGDPNLQRSEYDTTKTWSSFMVDTNWNYTDPATTNQTDINMFYISRNLDNSIYTGYNCTLGYTYAESWVDCDGIDCRVTKIRPSRKNLGPSNVTPWNNGTFLYYNGFLSNFPWATGSQHSTVTSPTDFYVAGSENPYNQMLAITINSNTDYTNVTGLQVARRLGTLTNTLWQNTITKTALVQSSFTNATLAELDKLFPILQTEAMMQTHTDVYAANKAWTTLTVIISFILLFCGIAGAVFKYLSSAPDILGYVSTLAKDNPYFHESAGNDALDGMERARLLRDVKVQIGNVRPGEGKAYIALRSIGEGEDKRRSRVQPTSKFRLWSNSAVR